MSEVKAYTVDDAIECAKLHAEFNTVYNNVRPRLEAFNTAVQNVSSDLSQMVQRDDVRGAAKQVSLLRDATHRFFGFNDVQTLNELVEKVDQNYAKFPDFQEPSWDVWKSGKGMKVDYDINHEEFQYMQKEMLHIRDGIALVQGMQSVDALDMDALETLAEDFEELYENNPNAQISANDDAYTL